MYHPINRAALKADARAAMSESRSNPYITALVFVAVNYLLNYLSMRVFNYDDIWPGRSSARRSCNTFTTA